MDWRLDGAWFLHVIRNGRCILDCDVDKGGGSRRVVEFV